MGKLYLCPTPIGNLQDISYRVLEILKTVDFIAAEDTRRTRQLLNHFDIDKKLFSYYEHNKIKSGEKIIDLIKDGNSIALVTDAGMPAISDPGEDLVRVCIDEEIDIVCVAGVSAFVNALVLSGLSTRSFCFEGFLDRTSKKRKLQLQELKKLPKTLIFYEAPHRLNDCLKDIFEVMGDRKISISRELTKKYEQTLRGSVSEVIEYFNNNQPRGEFVIVLDGESFEEEDGINFFDNLSIKQHIIYYIDNGFTKKDAIKKVAQDRKLKKSDVYKESLDI